MAVSAPGAPGEGAERPEGKRGPPIRNLPEDVIGQIAAGEVIERPASVVKELVENSLDAGATSVTVHLEAGGGQLVRVVDNGWGIAAGEVERALERHATSKLTAVADLLHLGTLGFRGEALPSIAAVSRMAIATRCAGELAGTKLHLEGGAAVLRGEVGCPVGTQIEVRDLLFNVPARQKFLKGQATEAAHVTEAVAKLALAHPSVHFRLTHGSRCSLHAPATADGLERARVVLGPRTGRRLHHIAGQESGIAVEAFVAAPELAQTTSRGVQLFVGRRPVRDRGLLHAVLMGYGELIAKGRYPVVVLFVAVPGAAVDVNVHPQKLEVRFADARAVYAAVRHVIQRGVAGAPWLADPVSAPGRGLGTGGAMQPRAGLPAASAPRPFALSADYARARESSLLPLGAREGHGAAPRSLAPAAPASGGAGLGATARVPQPPAAREPEPSSTAAAPHPLPSPAAAAGFFAGLRYLGQLDRTYLVCEGHGQLVLIDQHAAHERVAFERLRQRRQQGGAAAQPLLFSETVELTAPQLAAAADASQELVAVGFEIEPFGGSSVAIKAVPTGLRPGAASQVLCQLLDELADHDGSRAVSERREGLLATVACHSAVRAGDLLAEEEVRALLAALDQTESRTHCPHGRPVLLRLGLPEIAYRFGR